MNYCPLCGRLSFDFDPRFGAFRCFSLDCLFIDYKEEYGEGLLEKPSIGHLKKEREGQQQLLLP